MARSDAIARQDEKDALQVKRHFLHFGVKLVATLLFALIAGGLWLAWVLISGNPR